MATELEINGHNYASYSSKYKELSGIGVVQSVNMDIPTVCRNSFTKKNTKIFLFNIIIDIHHLHCETPPMSLKVLKNVQIKSFECTSTVKICAYNLLVSETSVCSML